jgi:hypothetical protein
MSWLWTWQHFIDQLKVVLNTIKNQSFYVYISLKVVCTCTFCVYRAAVKNKLRNYSGVYFKSHNVLQKNVKKKVIKRGTIHFLLTYNDKVWLYLGSVNKLFTVKSARE